MFSKQIERILNKKSTKVLYAVLYFVIELIRSGGNKVKTFSLGTFGIHFLALFIAVMTMYVKDNLSIESLNQGKKGLDLCIYY